MMNYKTTTRLQKFIILNKIIVIKSLTKIYENTTYVAKWISYKDLGTKVICSFDLDGGIGTFPSAIVEKGTTIKEILEKNGLTSPIKQGYMFKGWNIENTTKINEDTIIKALWSRIE